MQHRKSSTPTSCAVGWTTRLWFAVFFVPVQLWSGAKQLVDSTLQCSEAVPEMKQQVTRPCHWQLPWLVALFLGVILLSISMNAVPYQSQESYLLFCVKLANICATNLVAMATDCVSPHTVSERTLANIAESKNIKYCRCVYCLCVSEEIWQSVALWKKFPWHHYSYSSNLLPCQLSKIR